MGREGKAEIGWEHSALEEIQKERRRYRIDEIDLLDDGPDNQQTEDTRRDLWRRLGTLAFLETFLRASLAKDR